MASKARRGSLSNKVGSHAPLYYLCEIKYDLAYAPPPVPYLPYLRGGARDLYLFPGRFSRIQLKVTLPKVSLLLVESDEDAQNKNSGLLMEAAGMSMDLKTRRQDLTLMLHLDAVTLEDRARPDDSPFRCCWLSCHF